MPAEETAAAVPPEAGRRVAGAERERRGRFGWVEPAVWTDRMLAALENGVKGGRWYSLMDKVYAECGRGLDHQRWPNAYLVEHGLFTMVTAHALARQSR